MVLREAREDAVAGLPLGDALADGLDYPCSTETLVNVFVCGFLIGYVPAPSLPGTTASGPGKGYVPRARMQSRQFSETALILTRTCPNLGGSNGTSRRTRLEKPFFSGSQYCLNVFGGIVALDSALSATQRIAIISYYLPGHPLFLGVQASSYL